MCPFCDRLRVDVHGHPGRRDRPGSMAEFTSTASTRFALTCTPSGFGLDHRARDPGAGAVGVLKRNIVDAQVAEFARAHAKAPGDLAHDAPPCHASSSTGRGLRDVRDLPSTKEVIGRSASSTPIASAAFDSTAIAPATARQGGGRGGRRVAATGEHRGMCQGRNRGALKRLTAIVGG
jgi:hypothetical protein